MNKPPYIITPTSISVIWDGTPHVINNDHMNFNPLMQALVEGKYDLVPQYLNIAQRIFSFSRGNIRLENGVVYYKDLPLKGVVVDKLIQFLKQGMTDATPILNFIEKLMKNPSQNSVEQLYTFLSYKLLPLTAEGDVIGYKGVQNNYYSCTGNADTVVLKGRVNELHQIYNGIGEEIEVERRCVDDNKNNHCSSGLHVGSYDYAHGFGDRLMMVVFNPADAVSVPTDCNFQKLRVCKYRVVGEVTKTEKSSELHRACYEVEDLSDVDADESEDLVDETEADSVDVDNREIDVLKVKIRHFLEDCEEDGWECVSLSCIVNSIDRKGDISTKLNLDSRDWRLLITDVAIKMDFECDGIEESIEAGNAAAWGVYFY